MNVFLTGASGVIGRELARLMTSSHLGLKVISVDVDLLDTTGLLDFVEKAPFPDALVHLAAIVPTGRVQMDPFAAYKVNALGTGSIIQAFLTRNPHLWTLYASTSHVYRPSKSPIAESAPLEPTTIYGRTKLAGEMIASDLVSNVSTSSLCIARIFSVYSPHQRDSFLYPVLLSKKNSWDWKDPVLLHGWNNVRDFLPAEEVAHRLLRLVIGHGTGVFNVGSGKGLTVKDFAKVVLGLEVKDSLAEMAVPESALIANISRYERFLNGLSV